MNPFFFGETGKALYGVHHPPRGAKPRSSGVVLCYPFAQEYMRAHRAFRQLSLLLSAEGFHTLRFDYSGTGDSSGESRDMSLSAWESDLSVATEELMDVASVESVWLVGLRIGGSLAYRAAGRPGVKGIVLWDPIVFGERQLAEGHRGRSVDGQPILEVSGVPVFPRLKEELSAVDLMRSAPAPNLLCQLAVSEDAPGYQSLRDHLTAAGARVTYTCVPSDGRWSEFDNWGSALIPQALIRAIVDYLKVNAV